MAAITNHSDFGAQENKICHCFYSPPPSIYHEMMEPDAMILVFWIWVLSQLFALLFHPHQEIVQSKWGMDWLLKTQFEFPTLQLTWGVNLGNHSAALSLVPCEFNEAEDAKIVLVLYFCLIEMINYNSQMGNKKIEKWRIFFRKWEKERTKRRKGIQGLITASLGVD